MLSGRDWWGRTHGGPFSNREVITMGLEKIQEHIDPVVSTLNDEGYSVKKIRESNGDMKLTVGVGDDGGE